MSMWRQILSMSVFACSAGLALYLVLGSARHRAVLRTGAAAIFLILVVNAVRFVGDPSAPIYFQISAAVTAVILVVALPIAWRRARRERA